jgi:DNA methylase
MPAPTLVRKSHAPRVDPEFQSLIAPLTQEERRQLEANLAAEGCRDALVVWNGVVLDGHNRLEICTRLGIRYKASVIDLPSREAAKLWIEENQMGRRNLTPDQRAAIAYRILRRRVAISKTERARKGGRAGGSGRAKLSLVAGVSTEQKRPRLRELAAQEHGVSPKSIRAVSELVRHDPAIVEQIVNGELTLKGARERLRYESREARMRTALLTHARGNGIHTGDISKLYRLIPDNSVELFLTDPPWDKADTIPLFGRLAELAKAKLKPNGFCIVYCGSLFIPQVLSMMTEHLEYYWLCAIKLNGAHPRVWTKNIAQGFRPLLMFAKRPVAKKPTHQWFIDLIDGSGGDKDHHKWGQATDELEYLIDRLTQPGQLVVDPFCGGGAVPVACQNMKRKFIATEIDPGVAAAARARIATLRKGTRKG